MQLDPSKNLASQLVAYSSTSLEQLTAATCASVGYTVFRSLRYEVGGQHAAEIDVFASAFTPWRESRIVFECKGGFPTFEAVRKAASLFELVEPPPDDIVILCKQNCPTNRHELAALLGVRIVEKLNLGSYVLPLLGGASVRKERASELNRYLAWQVVHDFLVSLTSKHNILKQHYRFLTTELWTIGTPLQQVELSFEAYKSRFPDTSVAVAAACGTNYMDAIYNAHHDDVEAAFYVVLLHRLMNVYAIVRQTLYAMQHMTSSALVSNTGISLRAAMSALSEQPRLLFGFPAFLQTFFFVWGGFTVDAHEDFEVARMAEEMGTTPAAVRLYLEVLDGVFTGSVHGMFFSWNGLRFFRYVPGAVRGLGIAHRRALDANRYSLTQFFGASGTKYEAACDRALASIGGMAGLQYT